jgi:hypothetical protein
MPISAPKRWRLRATWLWGGLRKPPTARVPSRPLLNERDQLTKGDAMAVARIETVVPRLIAARDLVERLQGLVGVHSSVILRKLNAE